MGVQGHNPRCDCTAFHEAARDGIAIPTADGKAWYFMDTPVRRMSPKARYYAIERAGENHAGEPFRWVTCPFCGLDLHPTTPDIITRIDSVEDQGDGAE